MRVTQEFYCNECNGYFRVTLNMALNINVRVKCPNCGHLHDRHIVDGILRDQHSGSHRSIDEICPQKSSYTKKALHVLSARHMRNGVPVVDPTRDIVRDRWAELYGDRV